jgi:hypothetical protein
MAKKWIAKHTQTEVNFKVINLRPADHKAGYTLATVEYDSNHKQYTYCRKANVCTANPAWRTMVVDGCEITYDIDYNPVTVTRVYDTAGLKKQYNPGGANKSKTGSSSESKLSDAIKEEMVKKDIVKPAVVVNPDEEVRHEQYDTIRACLQSNIPVYLAGPAGSGKNYTVEQICNELGWDFYFSNSVQQEFKLTGFIDAGGRFHETEFYKACISDRDCVFFLDEMDASIPEVLVLLNAAIANGYFEFPNGKVELEHVHFVAAGNTVGSGADDMYTGRMVLDQATLDRFAIIEFDYSMRIEMAISNGNSDLVAFVHQLREASTQQGIRATFSYRCITRVTKLEKAGMDTIAILKISLFGGLDKDTINTLNIVGSTKYHTALKAMQTAA